jgi:hypothetical protein
MAINDIARKLDAIAAEVDRRIETAMDITGSKFVEDARKSVTQTIYDRITGRTPNREHWELTGKLRSSIGFAKKEDGDMKVLELSAGAEYAAAVEAKGYDVISNSIPLAEQRFDKYVKMTLREAAKAVGRL